MSLGSGKDKSIMKQNNDGGYKSDPYALLDDLLHDDETEIIVGVKNKYIALAAKTLLEDLNLVFYDSDLALPILAINLEDGNFKFIDHLEDKVSIEIPVEWDTLETDVKSYISDNPIVRKKVEHQSENWDKPDGEEDLIDKSMSAVKEQVKNLQARYNLTMDEVKETIEKYKNIAVKAHNKTKYTATGNPEMQLSSGTFNNIHDLVRVHGWTEEFKEKYGQEVFDYMRSNESEEGIEKRILSEFGFEYCIDQISVDDNKYWNNRVIEINYKDQKEEDFDIDIDLKDFEDQEEKINLNIDMDFGNGSTEYRIKKDAYRDIVYFAKFNKLYDEFNQMVGPDKTLEEYLVENNDRQIVTELLNKCFQNFTDFQVFEMVNADGKYDWKTTRLVIATSDILQQFQAMSQMGNNAVEPTEEVEESSNTVNLLGYDVKEVDNNQFFTCHSNPNFGDSPLRLVGGFNEDDYETEHVELGEGEEHTIVAMYFEDDTMSMHLKLTRSFTRYIDTTYDSTQYIKFADGRVFKVDTLTAAEPQSYSVHGENLFSDADLKTKYDTMLENVNELIV